MTVILRDIQLSVLLVAQRVQTFLSKHSEENQQDESLSLLYLPVILTALRQITILKPGKKKVLSYETTFYVCDLYIRYQKCCPQSFHMKNRTDTFQPHINDFLA